MISLNSKYFRLVQIVATFLVLLTPGLPVFAGDTKTTDEQCLINFLQSGEDDMTLGEIRARCSRVTPEITATEQVVEQDADAGAKPGRVEARLHADREAAAKPFSLLAHKPNYILAVAYNFEGWAPEWYQLTETDPEYTNKDYEAQFQISLKVPLTLDLFNGHMDIYGAYTNRSFWQVYNSDYSEPFRETNHEPELWAQFGNDWNIWGFHNALNSVGWVHQSNGAAGLQSRSWNRLYANFVFEKDNFAFSFKPWIWLSKDKSISDNPDITDFMGHGEFRFAWQRNDHVVTMMLRNQLESGFDKGAVELGWSIPVFNYPYLKAYVQYFNGYGESLIDYNRKVNRIGVGISLTDWID
jgi:phospholipase A1